MSPTIRRNGPLIRALTVRTKFGIDKVDRVMEDGAGSCFGGVVTISLTDPWSPVFAGRLRRAVAASPEGNARGPADSRRCRCGFGIVAADSHAARIAGWSFK